MIKTCEFPVAKNVRALRATVAIALLAVGAHTNAQLAIPGKFDVTPLGAASYTIPIQVPPGVNGMEPKLAFNYNSRSGNGVMGLGWSLSGLPAITRCPRTTPQDGVKGPVAYTANDRFCLDGQRLVLTSASGAYGSPNSTYATEIDSFVKVTAVGSAGAGPQYFVVKTKDGQTVELGGTPDSRILVANQASPNQAIVDPATVRVWAMNRSVDNFGNTQTVTYGLPPAISTSATEYNVYPLRVDYTSNPGRSLQATNSVEFTYATRPDSIKAYQGGRPFNVTVRLSSVVTKTKINGVDTVVATYTPTYADGVGGRSVVTSISQCEPSGLCAPSTRFGIGSSSPGGLPAPSPTVLPVTQVESTLVNGKWLSLDLNNDGKTDLIHLTETSGVYRSWLSNGDGTFTIRDLTTTADTSLNTGSWQVLDVNGDGLADLIHLTTTPGAIKIWTSRGDGEFTISDFSTTVDGDLNQESWVAIDVNGDGLGDLVHFLPSLVGGDEPMRVWQSNGDGTFTVTARFGDAGTIFGFLNGSATRVRYNLWYRSKFQVFDVNGDGLADIIQLGFEHRQCYECHDNLYMVVRKSNADGTFTSTKTLLRSWNFSEQNGKIWMDAMVPIDANQDGFMDFIWIGNKYDVRGIDNRPGPTYWGENTAELLLSKGDGSFDRVPASQAALNIMGTWQAVDVEGDGLQDLIYTPENLTGGGYHLYRSRGDGTFDFSTVAQSADTCSSPCTDFKAGDFLGTGAPGFVRVDGQTVRSAWLLSRPPGGLITSVSNGLNNVTSWDFAALPALGASYVRDIPSDNNTWTVTPAMPVVSTVRSRMTSWNVGDSLSHLERTTFYSYGSARVERNGRGFLGFNWLQSADFDTSLTTRTYFSQAFPSIGRVLQQGTGTGAAGAWNNLTLDTTQYGCTLLDGGNSCPQSPGKRYFVYPSQIDSQKWDLDGTPMPRTRVVNSNPDTFGNLRSSVSTTLNPDGSPTGYSKAVANEYYNNDAGWIIGRLLTSTVTSTAPDVPAVVVPGSGNLPPAATPQLPTKTVAAISAILQLLLSDD